MVPHGTMSRGGNNGADFDVDEDHQRGARELECRRLGALGVLAASNPPLKCYSACPLAMDAGVAFPKTDQGRSTMGAWNNDSTVANSPRRQGNSLARKRMSGLAGSGRQILTRGCPCSSLQRRNHGNGAETVSSAVTPFKTKRPTGSTSMRALETKASDSKIERPSSRQRPSMRAAHGWPESGRPK